MHDKKVIQLSVDTSTTKTTPTTTPEMTTTTDSLPTLPSTNFSPPVVENLTTHESQFWTEALTTSYQQQSAVTSETPTSMQTGRILPDISSPFSYDPQFLFSTVPTPLVSSYQMFSYEGGMCFVETNVHYASASSSDDFAQYFAHSFEKCCLDCSRLAICLSWSYSGVNQTCTLKKAFRATPTLVRDVISGFKPSELYSLSIVRGLEFVNLDTEARINPYTLIAINYPNSTVSLIIRNDIETQVIPIILNLLFLVVSYSLNNHFLILFYFIILRLPKLSN